MTRINKEYQLGGGIVLKVGIENGVAVMISNYGKEMEKIYHKTKQAGKKVDWDYRRQAMIEQFDISDEEYAKLLDRDFATAKVEQLKVQKFAGEKK